MCVFKDKYVCINACVYIESQTYMYMYVRIYA